MEQETQSQSPYLIPGSIVIAGVIIALAVFYTNGGGNGKIANNIPSAPIDSEKYDLVVLSEKAKKLLEEQEGDFVLGDPSAPITMVEFGDFQCSFCSRFFKETVLQIKEKYIKTGKVKLIWRDFAFLGQESLDAASAARCAGEQGKFWDFHDYLFTNQGGENKGGFTVENLKGFAVKLGLNSTDFNTCLDSGKYEIKIKEDTQKAPSVGVSGTPSTFINGQQITGAQPFSVFESLIDSLL